MSTQENPESMTDNKEREYNLSMGKEELPIFIGKRFMLPTKEAGDIADFILAREKEIRASYEIDDNPETWEGIAKLSHDKHQKEIQHARADERIKIAERVLKAQDVGNILASPLDKMVAMEVECYEILNEKKVDG